jgi:hypothetical protein
VKAHEWRRLGEGRESRSQINMPPERIPYRFRIIFKKRGAYLVFHPSIKGIIAQFAAHSIAAHEKINYIWYMFIHSRQIGLRAACLIFGLCLFSQIIVSQEIDFAVVPVPDELRRPERGEAPRYPEDLVIGELGQGRAPLGAYQFAQELLSALTRGRNDAPVLERSASRMGENVFEDIGNINPRSYRIGGGRSESDGSVSFVVRFIGRTESITGELFVRFETPRAPTTTAEHGEDTGGAAVQEGARWLLDDLMLEEKIPLSDIRDEYRYDFSPYERFF